VREQTGELVPNATLLRADSLNSAVKTPVFACKPELASQLQSIVDENAETATRKLLPIETSGEKNEHYLGHMGLVDGRLQYLHIHPARLGFFCPTP
jgi:hypothetical protein